LSGTLNEHRFLDDDASEARLAELRRDDRHLSQALPLMLTEAEEFRE
jgi:hypothetical protein